MLYALRITVKEAIEKSLLGEEFSDPAVVPAILWAAVRGVIMLEITMTDEDRMLLGSNSMPFDKRLSTLTKALLRGLATTAPGHPEKSH